MRCLFPSLGYGAILAVHLTNYVNEFLPPRIFPRIQSLRCSSRVFVFALSALVILP